MKRPSINIKNVWTHLSRTVDSAGNTLELLLSPTRDAEATKRFFHKALSSPASSAPQAHLLEEQGAEPTAVANPVTPTPRVITVEKNAATPPAMAELKAAGQLLESVELKPGHILQHHGRTRPSLSQTSGQARDGLLFGGDPVANEARATR